MTRTWLWGAALLFAAGCLKLTPAVVPVPDAAKSLITDDCLACINEPEMAGGCGNALAACTAAPSCERGYRCALQNGCYAGPVGDLPICARSCAEIGGIVTSEDPSTQTALALYQCILGECHARCFVAASATDGGGVAPDLPPPTDGGGACTGASDRAAAGAPSFADVGRECGLECIGTTDKDCSARCVERHGLTPGCARCYGDAITCAAASCLVDCIDPANPACRTCTARSCDPAFHACAGL